MERSQGSTVLRDSAICDLVKNSNLIENFDLNCLQPASYDLRVGEEYFQNGEITPLREGGSVTIASHDLVIVSSYETFHIPEDIVGSYDLRMTYLYKGLFLQKGLHLDPGYDGKIFSLLFNLSNADVTLVYKEPFASVAFSRTTQPTEKSSLYRKHGQPQVSLREALPIDSVRRSGLRDLYEHTTDIMTRVSQDMKVFTEQTEEKLREREERAEERLREGERRTETIIPIFLLIMTIIVMAIAAVVGSQAAAVAAEFHVHWVTVGIIAGAFVIIALGIIIGIVRISRRRGRS